MRLSEHAIQNQILLALGRRPDLGRFWRQNTGAARSLVNDRLIRFGIKGGADISGILKDGRRVELEVKTERGRQSERQRRFQAMILNNNGIYAVVRSPEQAIATLEEAL